MRIRFGLQDMAAPGHFCKLDFKNTLEEIFLAIVEWADRSFDSII